MKNLLVFILSLTIISCSNGKETKEIETPVVTTEIPSVGVSDTGGIYVSKEEPRKSIFPIGTFKTLPEIINHIFSEGSTKNEVRKVQGDPDMIERPSLYEEVWYYGNCEVHFKGQIVRNVINVDKSLKYASWGDLIFSPDKIEAKFSSFLTDRMAR